MNENLWYIVNFLLPWLCFDIRCCFTALVSLKLHVRQPEIVVVV